MDHYAASLGGILSVHFGNKLNVSKLKNPLKEFVLADSLLRKDTTGTLGFIKNHVLQGVSSLRKKIKGFTLKSPLTQEVEKKIENLSPEVKRLLKGTLLTRNLTAEGEALFESNAFDHVRFGQLLYRQQEVLRDYLHISHPKINKMIEASLKAGALGAKINGSGEGGCIFAYAPEKAEEVANALEKEGTKPHIIHVDEGAKAAATE
jgi:galactokinase